MSLESLRRDLGANEFANGLIGWLFAATAPVAIILAVGRQGGLTEAQMASWIFGAFVVNGLLTLVFSLRWRIPLAFGWTIPGTVLVGPALTHLSFSAVVGAFIATGVLMLLLGASGLVGRVMRAAPMPIVMAMVAGVFLRFGLDLVKSLHADPWIAAPMVVGFIALSAVPAWSRRLPPMFGVLIVGVIAALVLGRFDASRLSDVAWTRPIWPAPTFSWAAMVELVVPLAITVLVVQNGQGFAVLKAAGHEPPVNAITTAVGVCSIAAASVGSVCSCLTGPVNGILSSSAVRERHYAAAIVFGVLGVISGCLAPVLTRFMLIAPTSLIATLAGLALLRVLHGAFAAAFKGRYALGSLVSFLVTVADLPLFNIGAAFWGLVAGVIVSLLLERKDFADPS